MKSKPASRKASSRANEVFSSAVQPKTLPPKQKGATIRAVARSGLRQRGDHLADVACQSVETRRLRERRLVHVKRAVDLDLHGMRAGCGRAVMFGDEAAGIGLVPLHDIALAPQSRFDHLDQRQVAARAVTVANDEIRLDAVGLRPRRAAIGGHRMAVDQHGEAELPDRPLHQPPQGPVIRLVESLDPLQRVLHRQPARIDFLRLANDPRDGAQAPGNPHGAGIDIGGELPLEHARVELVGLAVHVEIGAGKARLEERRADGRGSGEEILDIGVLGAAQRHRV
jgi:hypothetical protein